MYAFTIEIQITKYSCISYEKILYQSICKGIMNSYDKESATCNFQDSFLSKHETSKKKIHR